MFHYGGKSRPTRISHLVTFDKTDLFLMSTLTHLDRKCVENMFYRCCHDLVTMLLRFMDKEIRAFL